MISVYGDGSSHAKGGKPGGWGFVIVVDGKPIACGAGGDPETSNNLMEMTALIKGLQCLERLQSQRPELRTDVVELVSDSQYALGMASGGFSPSKNHDVVAALRHIVVKLKLTRFRWVRGHQGDTYNERCDGLAAIGKKMAMGTA